MKKLLSLIITVTMIMVSIPILTFNILSVRSSIKDYEVVNYMNSLVGQKNNYVGYCLKFVSDCWVNMGFASGGSWGNAANFASHNTVSTSRDNIPIGADVYFTSPSGNGHIGIHVGSGYFVHAGSASTYEKSNISEPYYSNRYIGWGWHPNVTVEPTHTHSYSSTVTKSATCISTGVRKYTCSCGSSYTETIPTTAHTTVYYSAVSPTCTSFGRTAGYKCSYCGKVTSGMTTVSPLEHNYGDWSVTKKATCTALGERSRVCSRCKATNVQPISALGHDYKKTVVKATCTKDGYNKYKCSRCGNTYTTQIAGTATYSSWSTVKPKVGKNQNLETKTQYSFSKKETKTVLSSTSVSSEWEKSGTVEEWGNWSNWTTNPVGASSTRQVETKSDIVSYNMVTYCCGNSSGTRCYLPYTQSGYTLRAGPYNDVWSVDKLNRATTYAPGSWFSYATNVNGYVIGPGTAYCSFSDGGYTPYYIGSANYGTYYRYRDLVIYNVYCKWGEYSDWSDTQTYTPGETLQMKTRTLYRLKTTSSGAKATGHSYKSPVVTKATTKANGKSVKTCKICGHKSTSIIYKPAVVSLSATKLTYTGKSLKPTVTVTDSKGKKISSKYYTVSYKNNKKIGTATITVTFSGKYKGTMKKTFKIVPAQVKGLKITSASSKAIGFKWSSALGAKFYKVQKYDAAKKKWVTVKTTANKSIKVTGLKSGTTYKFRVISLDSSKKYSGKASSTLKAKTF